MRRGSLFLIFISFLFNSVSNSQDNNWKTFFCGRDINSVASKGKNLYAGTNNGFVRIDLETDEIKIFNKSNNNIDLANASNIYIKKDGDVIFRAGNNSGWFTYYNYNSYFELKGAIFGMNCAAEDSESNLYVGGPYGGVDYEKYDSQYGGKIWYQFIQNNSPLPGNDVYGLHFDKNQNLWILVGSKGLVKYDGTNWTIFEKPDTIQQLTTMVFDKDENIWIGTQNGLLKFSNRTWTQYNPPIQKYLDYAKPWVTSIAIDSLNNVWIGSMFTGLYKFDGTNWIRYLANNSNLESSWINSVNVDYKNRVWVGTYIGLYRLDGDSFIQYNTSNCSIPNVEIQEAIPDSKGNVWILNNDYGSPDYYPKSTAAITKYDGKNFTVYKAIDVANTKYNFYAMTVDQNSNVWTFTNNTLYKFDGTKWMSFNFDLLWQYYPCKMCVDLFGNLWIINYSNNILRFDGKNFKIFETSNSLFPRGETACMKTTGNFIYIGFYNDSKIYKIDVLKSKDQLDVSKIPTPANNIRDVNAEYRNEIWIAGDTTGVFKYDGNSWTNYNYHNSGLPNNVAVSVDVDKKGNVLVGCGYDFRGLPWLGGVAYFDRYEWKTFRYSDSNLNLFYINNASFDINGNAWIAGYGGVCVFNPKGVNINLTENPTENSLSPNYPNPTNGYALINYKLTESTNVKIIVFDVLGREVVTLTDDYIAAGNYTIGWDGKNKSGNTVASGVYIYSLITNQGVLSKKLMWLK